MPKKKRVRNSVIDKLLIQHNRADQSMSTIKPISKGTYKERATYFGEGGASADWQGPIGGLGGMSQFPGTNDQMPGTTPIFPKLTPLERLLELLRIKKKRRPPMTPPKLNHPGFI